MKMNESRMPATVNVPPMIAQTYEKHQQHLQFQLKLIKQKVTTNDHQVSSQDGKFTMANI